MTPPNGTAHGLSVILPLRSAPKQAEKTLASLSPPYQEHLEDSVEILVVEAPSDDMLGEERARAGRDHVRYFRLDGDLASRTRSIELGLRESRTPFVGIFLDAAHLCTPRVLDTTIRAFSLANDPLVVLPQYRLDPSNVPDAGSVDAEQTFFEQSRWRKNAYDLFKSARFGPANPNGFLGPLLGAAAFFAPRRSFEALLPLDARLDVPGATALRLQMYTELSRRPGTRLIVLGGEGAFRQHHVELEAPSVIEEETDVHSLIRCAASALPNLRAVHREPLMFGTAPGPVLRFVAESAGLAEFHCAACRSRGEPPWYEDG